MEKREPFLRHCWWECELVQSLWKIAWRLCKKLKIELPYAPAIPFLDTYPETETKLLSWTDIDTPKKTAVLFTTAKVWKQPFKSGNRLKKEENPIICDSTHESGEHGAKWNNSNRKKQISHGITHVEKKSWTHRNIVEWELGSEGKWGEIGKRLQIFSYIMNMFWGSNV